MLSFFRKKPSTNVIPFKAPESEVPPVEHRAIKVIGNKVKMLAEENRALYGLVDTLSDAMKRQERKFFAMLKEVRQEKKTKKEGAAPVGDEPHMTTREYVRDVLKIKGTGALHSSIGHLAGRHAKKLGLRDGLVTKRLAHNCHAVLYPKSVLDHAASVSKYLPKKAA